MVHGSLQGELEHRTPKSRYTRTSRKGFLKQMTQIERRQARIHRIRKRLESKGELGNSTVQADIATSPDARYHLGKTQNQPVQIMSFMYQNSGDPAVKVIHLSESRVQESH